MTTLEGQRKLKEVRVAILTPYLFESFEHLLANSPDPGYVVAQIEEFKFNPTNNLSEVKGIETNRHRVELTNPGIEERCSDAESFRNCLRDPLAVLAISGSTEETEEEIGLCKGSGIIVARYSVFYGGPSKYTGNSPEAGGYSLDIPKDTETVRKMLTNDRLIGAIARRNKKSIESALSQLNRQLSTPILTTPYLEQALSVERKVQSK